MDFHNKTPSRTLPVLADLVIAALVVLCAGMILAMLGCSEPSAEEITAASEREAHDKKITFTMPIEYTATVTQCNSNGCKTRLYFPSRSK